MGGRGVGYLGLDGRGKEKKEEGGPRCFVRTTPGKRERRYYFLHPSLEIKRGPGEKKGGMRRGISHRSGLGEKKKKGSLGPIL